MLTNIFYHLDNNYFAYFHAFGHAVLQKSGKIGQKPVFHKNTDFSVKMAFSAIFFQICLKMINNCLKLLLHLDSTTSQTFLMSFVAWSKNFKKIHKNLKKWWTALKDTILHRNCKNQKTKKISFLKNYKSRDWFSFLCKICQNIAKR